MSVTSAYSQNNFLVCKEKRNKQPNRVTTLWPHGASY